QRAFGSFVQTDSSFAWALKAGSVADGLVDEAAIVSILEDNANSLNLVVKRNRSPSLRHAGPKTLKIVAGQFRHKPVPAEGRNYPRASRVIVTQRPLRQLSAVHKPLLGCEKTIHKVFNG